MDFSDLAVQAYLLNLRLDKCTKVLSAKKIQNKCSKTSLAKRSKSDPYFCNISLFQTSEI